MGVFNHLLPKTPEQSSVRLNMIGLCSLVSRFPSKPYITGVPFFLLFSFNKETPNKKGKRVLLGYLGLVTYYTPKEGPIPVSSGDCSTRVSRKEKCCRWRWNLRLHHQRSEAVQSSCCALSVSRSCTMENDTSLI